MQLGSGSSRWIHAMRVVARRGAGQDRAIVRDLGEALIIALADGAGGTGRGDRAAQAVIDDAAAAPADALWLDRLAALDAEPARLGHGQTTAVALTVTASGIIGASLGDSAAWRVSPSGYIEVTADQPRKPLLGDGGLPCAFAVGPLAPGETLLVASDGLLAYARPAELAHLAAGPDLEAAADALIDRVRLRSGDLPDDVSLVLCRPRMLGA